MTKEEAQALAVRLMIRHGLIKAGWKFGFNDRKRALGLCSFRDKKIYLSAYFIPRITREELTDTILHEIAHALDFMRNGKSDGHGPKWKSIAKEIGAKPERLFSGSVSHQWKYVLTYEGEVVRGYHRIPTDIHLRIARMGVKGKPDSFGKLKLVKLA